MVVDGSRSYVADIARYIYELMDGKMEESQLRDCTAQQPLLVLLPPSESISSPSLSVFPIQAIYSTINAILLA
jgi:hypothetical protein